MSNPVQPVIVVKKKNGHGAHHGGAWKVAYADFVTAMMAFFLVMWLVNQSKPVKAAIGGYFRDPAAFDASGGRGVLPGGDTVNPPRPETNKKRRSGWKRPWRTSARGWTTTRSRRCAIRLNSPSPRRGCEST
jgi:flagellar motor protein MotB